MARSGRFLAGLALTVVFAVAGVAAPAGAQVTSVVVANPGTQSTAFDQSVSLQLHASGGTQPYRWSAISLPPFTQINSATGLISGDVRAFPGTLTVTVTATDAAGASGSVQFDWHIQPGCPHC